MTNQELTHYATNFRVAIIGAGPRARMCAAISAPLSAALAVMGIPSMLVESDLGECNHVFLRLEDGRILDPTADQFNWISRIQFPPVYLGAPAVIHERAVPYDGDYWRDLLREFKRLCPEFAAREVGGMVRMALATFPAGMVELPNCCMANPAL